MAIIVGTDAYVDVATADEIIAVYSAENLAKWNALDETTKENALKLSVKYKIDRLQYPTSAIGDTLVFPFVTWCDDIADREMENIAIANALEGCFQALAIKSPEMLSRGIASQSDKNNRVSYADNNYQNSKYIGSNFNNAQAFDICYSWVVKGACS